MGLLAKAILCFLLIHLSLSSGSGYEQGNENNGERGGMMVRINRRLGRRGGGRSSSSSNNGAASKKTPNTSTGNNKNNNGGGTASRRVPVTGGIYGAGASASHRSMAAPLSCNRNNFSLLAAAIVAILLAAEF
ncbi:hypothetical protein MKW92_016682 [Papaver armeniacum]|nr:hypothetical protein MKW92_016682 [Papaver armeniacum]